MLSNNESKLPKHLITAERSKVNSEKAPFHHPSLIDALCGHRPITDMKIKFTKSN